MGTTAGTHISVAPDDIQKSKGGAERIPDPGIIVIFGASGDLTKRKLLPALFHLEQAGLLPKNFAVVGVARRDLSETFAADMREGIIEGGGVDGKDAKLDEFVKKISYFATDFDSDDGYTKLKARLEEIDTQAGTKGNRLFYLATAPEYFEDIIDRLGKHGMNKEPEDKSGYVHVVIEKPFGHDLESARELSDNINKVFEEDQIFRIDHYLGKETVQNILVFRFANGIFEHVWNRNYIDHVQITAAESIGIEGRGPFYEKAGALRDVVQNHIMELISFVTMEPPVSFDDHAVRAEQLKVWQSMRQIPLVNTVRGQYGPGTVDGEQVKGYRQEDRVDPKSQTETFVALQMQIENWRWADVPFYVRAGKRMAKRVTEITIEFKQPPMLLFRNTGNARCGDIQPNIISMRIQPDEGISLRFAAKYPGTSMTVCPVTMDFSYAQAFGTSSANGYERLLLDAMLGDATLFAHRDGVEATWAIMTPVLEQWQAHPSKDFPNYAAGTWGPKAAEQLIARDGREWRKL
jgi:glucose-6-phosphate 1-dehydrogenase